MAIAEDLSQVFKEIGSKIEILGTLPAVFEYVDITKTDREGFFTCTFPSTTKAVPGSVISVSTSGEKFLILHVVKQQFENTIVLIDAAMVYCRNSVNLKRLSESKDPVTREKDLTWTDVSSNFCYISQTTTGNILNSEFDEAFFNEKNKKMFISASSGVKTGDRAEFSTVKLQVGDIDNLRYPGVCVCELFEDER
jgi:hypothetical protein